MDKRKTFRPLYNVQIAYDVDRPFILGYELFSQVSDGGLALFKDCKKLTKLTLSETQVSDAGIKHLAGLKTLQALNLHATKVTPAGVGALQQALPGCKIEPARAGADSAK